MKLCSPPKPSPRGDVHAPHANTAGARMAGVGLQHTAYLHVALFSRGSHRPAVPAPPGSSFPTFTQGRELDPVAGLSLHPDLLGDLRDAYNLPCPPPTLASLPHSCVPWLCMAQNCSNAVIANARAPPSDCRLPCLPQNVSLVTPPHILLHISGTLGPIEIL